MIISRTPFRMSFIGGGTDLPLFYSQEQGAVISTTIDKYVYLTVSSHFDKSIRVSYSKTEIVQDINELKHPLFREVLKDVGVDEGVEITSVADIPAGTGLGSSSSFTVGLYKALYSYCGIYKTAYEIAEKACNLEMNILREPIGKQDQFAAAYGGFRKYLFNPDESVSQESVYIPYRISNEFFDHIMLFYLGGTRDASTILHGISKSCNLSILRALVDYFWEELKDGDMINLGLILDEAWSIKKNMTGVSNQRIDDCYAAAKRAGALGGKILGAGQTGFLMLFCPPERQNSVRYALSGLREFPVKYEPEGSKIIYAD